MESNNYSNGFSSPRAEAFPNGLRVLVVDDDPTWLKILEKMLKKCSYEVTTCCLAREALNLLRERKDGYDIVISDVNMPDMDGFKLLEHVGLEMDLPVIMMSVDGETSRVMKGVQHGACDYLLKPIRMKELKNIWQHVFRKRIHEVRDIEGHEEIQMMKNGISEQSDDGYFFCGGDLNMGKKRKDFDNKHDEKDFSDPSLGKKTRVVWTIDLHQKFVKAVNHIGFHKVGPKKILDLMNVPWLTRENVASHLQKYRLYLSRLQKDNDLKASYGGMKLPSEVTSKEQAGSTSFQNSINAKQNDAANNYGIPGNFVIQNTNPRIHEAAVSLPILEPRAAVICDAHEAPKTSSSGLGVHHSFGKPEPDANFSTLASIIPVQYSSWSRKVPEVQSKQENKPYLDLHNGFNLLSMPDLHHQSLHAIFPRTLNKERDKPSRTTTKTLGGNTFELGPVQSESPTTNFHPADPNATSTWNMKNQVIDQVLLNDVNTVHENLILGNASPMTSLDDNFPSCLLQEDCSPINFELQNRAFSECNEQETPIYLYDSLRLDYEYPCESVEYPVIDQGLFIA